ncbi:MAG: bifunctional DNA-formamidopyrimidine glycosylase/DNA-(apurinic or apyrimidinic site) lyase [Myxococcales bacterium]|nr:bifunctional DNA-formamidopyrimidine glycosylase/DNA-(apurinic or apyrimidinic site) lyase [Myxococcales bacterium]
MPELPEVEFAARRLRAWAMGRRIVDLGAEAARPLRDITPKALKAGAVGRGVVAVRRLGKQLFLDLDDGQVLWAHLGMTGKFVRGPATGEPRAGRRAWFLLDDGQRLDFLDSRRFGRLRLLPRAAVDAHAEVAGLGPDALALSADAAAFGARLAGTRRAVKVALMDQGVMAGVGNIYASEALFLAGVAPGRPANGLTPAELARLAAGTHQTMTESLARERNDEIRYLQEVQAQNPFRVYGRAGEPCPVCQTPILRITQAQRSTFWCPACQPG